MRCSQLERCTGEIVAHVFHRDGQPIRSMRGAWDAACERAGLSGWLFHDLRRTAVRNLEGAGVSRSVAMSFTGHETESVYQRYAITDPDSQEAGAAKLARFYSMGAGKPSTITPIQQSNA